jgi:hypothetical protein
MRTPESFISTSADDLKSSLSNYNSQGNLPFLRAALEAARERDKKFSQKTIISHLERKIRQLEKGGKR